METEIQNFYKHKTVFLTGGTGFLGKVFMEKLLRTTDVERIYLLIRPKRNKSIEERIQSIFDDPLFEQLHKLKPQPTKRIATVSGDCSLPQLGLSKVDRAKLIEQVDVVVHSAATVRFNELLSSALAINVRATLDLIEMAKNMIKLKAFVHVSSAFANCFVNHIEERFYVDDLKATAQKVCRILDTLGPEILNHMSDKFCKGFPNTYCYTKSLAEQAVLAQGSELPICVFRPGIIVSTCKEPVSGWIDNYYGPTSILLGVATGVLRVMYMDMNSYAHVVPVDICANAILAVAWKTAKSAQQKLTAIECNDAVAAAPNVPPIYNLTPDNHNLLKWSCYRDITERFGMTIPLSRMLWFPFMIHTTSKLLFTVMCFFYHTVPGYFFDMALFLMGKQRRMVKMYRKIHKQMGLLDYFVENTWHFDHTNTKQLIKSMSPEDQKLYNFDMLSIDWWQYFKDSLSGMRKYLSKEEPTTIPIGLQLLSRLLILHRAVQFFVYGGGSTLLLFTFSRLMRSF